MCRTDLRFSPFVAFGGSVFRGSQSPALSIMTRAVKLLCGSDALQVTASDSEPTETYVRECNDAHQAQKSTHPQVIPGQILRRAESQWI